MLDADLVLLAGGRSYAGWKSMSLQRSMEACTSQFRLGVSERWDGQDVARAIKPTQRCEVQIGGETVVTGYVDEVELSIDASTHAVEVTGRDAAADLVDCSAIRKAGQWRGRRIEQIAAELAAPFGVAVRADVDTGKPLTSFALQEGETVFDAMDRAARIRALLLVSDGKGGLVITRAGTTRAATPLVLGDNILSARVRQDMRDRHSVYIIKGQAAGTDFFNSTAVSQIAARATDAGVPRYRPLIITGDAPDLAATLQQRAIWEANVRAARSTRVEVVVRGWRHSGGLWTPNTLVHVAAPTLRLDDDLLITAVEFELTEDGGSTSRLQLTRRDAFQLLPIKQHDVAGGFWALPPKESK